MSEKKKLYPVRVMDVFAPEEALTNMCHASNLCLHQGVPMVVWFGGTKEGASDTAIWFSKWQGSAFSQPKCIASGTEAHWNPVLYEKKDGSLLLLYKFGNIIRTWKTMRCVSRDGGQHWDDYREMVPGDRGGRGPVRCKMLRLPDGRLLAGASLESGEWTAFCDRSDDDGETWHRSESIGLQLAYMGERTATSDIAVSEQSFYGRGVIQPSLWCSDAKHVHMMLRSTEGALYRSDSCDGGETWCSPYRTELPNNNSGIDVVCMHDGTLLLCSNPVGENWGARTPLTVQASFDQGETWHNLVTLEHGVGEFAYPCIVASGNSVHITYTNERKTIRYREFLWC